MKAVDRGLEFVRPEQEKANLISVGIGIAVGFVAYSLTRKFLAFSRLAAGPPPDISISSGSVHLKGVDEEGSSGEAFQTHYNAGDYSYWKVCYWPDSSSPVQTLTWPFNGDGELLTNRGHTITLSTHKNNSHEHPMVRMKVHANFHFSPGHGSGDWVSDSDEMISSFSFNGGPAIPAGSYPKFEFYAS